ncbi:MAG: glycosyltransferase family 4 protein [Tissierella sp.]|uniref:glycosyltransferase family 4 protein n=1 Tax=Tissierella sp. TaxID=41274 RepID=UPI003F9A68C2
MKILYIIPNETVKTGGNWITVTRLAKGFKKRGVTVDIVEVNDVTRKCLEKYDVIHAFHVFKSLLKIHDLLIHIDKTIIVSFTGTDLKQLQEAKESKDKIIDLLNKTDGIIVFHDEAREKTMEEGIFEEKIKVIPQTPMSVGIEKKHKEKSTRNLQPSNNVTFLFAAGIRRVKAPLKMLELISGLKEKIGNIQLIVIGPILEEELGDKFKKKINEKKWAKYFGEVSHKKAQEFILESDIVINTSISEGMPNTLLEAQQMGKPIIATNIAGNKAIVNHGVDGFLFNDEKEFQYYATKLVEDLKLRKEMGESGLKSREKYDLEEEVNIYEKVYRT